MLADYCWSLARDKNVLHKEIEKRLCWKNDLENVINVQMNEINDHSFQTLFILNIFVDLLDLKE